MMNSELIGMEEYHLFEDLMLDTSPFGLLAPSVDVDDVVGRGKCPPGDIIEQKLVVDQAGRDILDDLLCLSNPQADPFEQEWMENMDLSHFLDSTDVNSLVPQPQDISVVQEAVEPAEVKVNTIQNRSVLHELLTQPNYVKATVPSSPEAQVAPVFEQLDLLQDSSIVDTIMGQSVTSISNGEEVATEISFDSGIGDDILMDSSLTSSDLVDTDSAKSLISSPLTVEEINSFLSGSEPSSPSSISDPDYSPNQSDDEDYTPKSRQKSRQSKESSAPYEKPTPGMNKKDRKKVQNKNAAIRYRQKKKSEVDNIKTEESELVKKNTELKEKVDQITREIKYMKDLMAEVCKAKGIKITYKKSKLT